MSLRRTIRTKLVDKLPKKYRFLIERVYLSHCVKNYIETEVKIMKQLCDPRKNSLDIGANQGVFTLFLSDFSSHVYCFEPLPWLCDRLSDKFSDSNVTIENCALANDNGDSYINIPSVGGKRFDTRSSLATNFENNYVMGEKVTDVKRVKVPLRRLDDFHIDNIGFIKIDVEGFEVETLRGARETIKQNMPNMFVEIEQKHHKIMDISDIFKYILGLGYHGYFIYNKQLRKIEEFDLDSMQNVEDETIGEYVNNFIFTPSHISTLNI